MATQSQGEYKGSDKQTAQGSNDNSDAQHSPIKAGAVGRRRSRPLRAKMARPIRRAGRWLRKLQRRARSRLWPHNFATYYDKIAGGDMVWPCSRKGLNMKVNRRNENGSLEVYISLNLIGLKLSAPPTTEG